MKICIVGSGGYIGTSLTNYCLDRDIEVVRVTSQKKYFPNEMDFVLAITT